MTNLSNEQLLFFANFIQKHTGIVYADANFYQLVGRLELLTKQLRLANVQELWKLCKNGMSNEIQIALLDLATNNETYFFRDEKVFQTIVQHCVPTLITNKYADAQIKIWSAACSTGQEPYSLSILLSELLGKEKPSRFQIDATDISQRVLDYAVRASYSNLEVQRGLSAYYLQKYFSKGSNDDWALKDQIKNRVRFQNLNLLDEWPGHVDLYDMILCRNVLIYQNRESKKMVIEKLASRLNVGGFLFLGAAESIIGTSDFFEQIKFGGTVYYKKVKSSQQQKSA